MVGSAGMSEIGSPPEDRLFERVAAILDEARSRVARTVNTAMVHAYWLVGREIVEVEQQGAERAGYGDELLKKLAAKLTRRFGKGFNLTGLKRMRQFYRAFPEGSALPMELGGPDKGALARHLSEGDAKGAPTRHLSTRCTCPPRMSCAPSWRANARRPSACFASPPRRQSPPITPPRATRHGWRSATAARRLAEELSRQARRKGRDPRRAPGRSPGLPPAGVPPS
jgi:hypothetical protein